MTPDIVRRLSSLSIDLSSRTRFSHLPDSEEAKVAHEDAEAWAAKYETEVIEIPDAKGDPCENLPQSYPISHIVAFDKSLRRN